MRGRKKRARVPALLMTLILTSLIASSCAYFSSDSPPAANDMVKAKFAYVVDGDTAVFDVAGVNTTVRLLGIDAPEMGTIYSITSKNYLKDALEGQTVFLERDLEQLDVYGRSLCYIWMADGALLNAAVVRDACAIVSIYPPNIKYAKILTQAQLHAVEKGGGLWAAYADSERYKDSRYVGNKNTKTLHRLNCSVLPNERNRVFFNSYDQAIKAGYSDCPNCLG